MSHSVRSVSSLLLLTSLLGCGSLTPADNERALGDDALAARDDVLSQRFDLSNPQSTSIVDQVATNDVEVFLMTDQSVERCSDNLFVFRLDELSQGIQEPAQTIVCPDYLDTPFSSFHDSLDVHGDLLAAGPFLFRKVAGVWQFEAKLGERRGEAGYTVLLSESLALTEMNGSHFLYERQGEVWRNTQRINGLRSGHGSADPTVGVYHNMYGNYQLVDGRLERLSDDLTFYKLHNGYAVIAAPGEDAAIWRHDGTTYVPSELDLEPLEGRAYRFHQLSPMFTDGRVTITTDRQTAVYDDTTGELVAARDAYPLPLIREARGATSYVSSVGAQLQWIHLVDPIVLEEDPDRSFTQTHTFALGAGEFVDFTFDMPHGMQDLTVAMEGTGDADLYVRFAEAPTFSDFDCLPYLWGSEESCSFSPSQYHDDAGLAEDEVGTWHVRVEGFEDWSEVTVTVTAIDHLAPSRAE